MEKQVVLFGGAFDPPHLGHLLVVKQVLKQVYPDELWLLPCFGHSFQKKLIEVNHRVAMTKLLAKTCKDGRVKLNLIEVERRSNGSTYQTWLWLKESYPTKSFSIVIGSDNLKGFTKWQQWEKLLGSVPIYVYIRQGYLPEPWFKGMKLLKGEEVSEVSSTQVRDRLKEGMEISDLVTPSVGQYIREQGLYR